MSVFLGNITYSPVTGYVEIQGDMSVVNSTIWVTEGKILKTNSGYAFCMISDKISDLSSKASDDFKPASQVCWIAHTKSYTRWTKENSRLPVEPTPLEMTISEYLEGAGKEWLDKSFKGKLHLIGPDSVLNGIKKLDKWDILFEFEECESNLIKDLTASSGSGFKRGGSSGQTEAQKLADRQTFIFTASGSHGKDCKDFIEFAFALSEMKKEAPQIYEELKWLIDSTIK